MDTPAPGFVVVVPVKPPAVGKSRLVGLADDHRADLARAFALDTVAAALAATRVVHALVVTDDAALAGNLAALGATAIPDGVTLDLNGTLRQGVAEAARRWPDLLPVALCADLPALRPTDLDDALTEIGPVVAAGAAAFVADAEGTGTVAYAAPAAGFEPHFGVASAAVHAGRGAVPVTAAAVSLRRDVDDPRDLAEALALGVGPRTAAVTAARTS